jgi:Flp pilus assembly pilin Flp
MVIIILTAGLNSLGRLLARQRRSGQAMVEYAVILALAIVIVIVVLTIVGNQVHNVFSNISCAIGKLGGSCSPPPQED